VAKPKEGRKERARTLYVEASDAQGITHEMIAMALYGFHGDHAEKITSKVCGDGKPRNLWSVTWKVVLRLKKMKKDLPFEFQVFVQNYADGPIVVHDPEPTHAYA